MIEFVDADLQPTDHLCVAFNAVQRTSNPTTTEFRKVLGEAPCTPLFVRDLQNHWYQDIEVIQARVARAIEQTAPKRVTFIGASMGGYGALLHGALAGADAILAFVPQTVIGPTAGELFGDLRWAGFQASIEEIRFPDLSLLRPPAARVTLCCSADEPLDICHVERLARHWNAGVITEATGAHSVTRNLKESGELIPLIRRSLL